MGAPSRIIGLASMMVRVVEAANLLVLGNQAIDQQCGKHCGILRLLACLRCLHLEGLYQLLGHIAPELPIWVPGGTLSEPPTSLAVKAATEPHAAN